MTPMLHCGQAVWDRLKELATPEAPPQPDVWQRLFGIPIHIDPNMPPGKWELREDGVVTRCGDFTPADPNTFYVPGLGFFSTTPEGISE